MFDARVVAGFDTEGFASAAVPHDVASLVAFGPLSIGTGNLLARHKHGRPMLLTIDVALTLHRPVYRIVEVLPRLVVR